MTSIGGWVLELAEGLDLPGWVPIPPDLEDAEQQVWLEECLRLLSPVLGSDRGDGEPTSETDLREVLLGGLERRAESDSHVLYQVWPVTGPFVVFCHVNLAAPDALPDWSDTEGSVHPAHGKHLGPGLQYATHQRVDHEGEMVDLTSAHFVFDDGEIALLLSLEESVGHLISRSIFGLTALKDAVRLKRSDGSTFTAVAPGEVRPWRD